MNSVYPLRTSWSRLAFLAAWSLTMEALAQTLPQTVTLEPGWNAVWLEVEPEDNRSDEVFSGLPVASVWARQERLSSVDFIQSASEEAFNQAGWQRWFPAHREASFLNNLFTVQANRAYLIKCTNTVPVEWNLVGRPSLRQPQWVPDVYNLRGLPIDSSVPPTFLNFFRHSPAHYDGASGQLRTMYRLDSVSGQWGPVDPADLIEGGTAYWIFTRGASDFLAPLNVDVDLGDGLDFGSDLTELDLNLENRTPSPMNALIRDLAGASNSVLSYYSFDPLQGGQWPELPSLLPEVVTGGAQTTLRLAARRQDLSESPYVSVMEVRDGAGTRLLIPVRVDNPALEVPQTPGGVQAVQGPPDPMAGLWVGSATLNAVSEAHSTEPATPTPTRSEFNLRLIVHVDELGQARLLKEVIQMWRDGTYTNNADGDLVPDQPGEYVLLTDDTLIPFFSGATVRDGVPVGRRLSSVGYDFESSVEGNFLEMTGSFGIGATLSGALAMPSDHPTNPFLHRYHPDHDNLNARFDGPLEEAYSTTREIELEFLASPPGQVSVPDFGYNEMGGNYSETITGIHKNPIHVSGTFRLSRVLFISELNPSPNL